MSAEEDKLMGAEQNIEDQTQSNVDAEEGLVDEVLANIAGGAGSGAAAEKDWKAEAVSLAELIDDLKDQAVRAKAEVQNIRRRAEKDVEKAHKFALEKFAKELLPIIDGLEKAIDAEVESGNEMTTLREGVDMTLSMFLSGVQKFSLEQIDPVGHPFDPALHEAMSMIEAPDSEPNTVIASMQKGYTLSGRLIRPAMVMVSKGAPKVDQKA